MQCGGWCAVPDARFNGGAQGPSAKGSVGIGETTCSVSMISDSCAPSAEWHLGPIVILTAACYMSKRLAPRSPLLSVTLYAPFSGSNGRVSAALVYSPD